MTQPTRVGRKEERKASAPRAIHIWEFPQEGFSVQLEPEVMKRLVNHAIKQVGGFEALKDILGIGHSTLYQYQNQIRFIPIARLFTLCEIAGDPLNIDRIEPHIIAYKGGPNARSIRNATLPIMETPALFEFLGHLVGDGGHNTQRANYTNTNRVLIQKFLKLLTMFGEVPYGKVVRKKGAYNQKMDCVYIEFGMTLIRLFHHLYQMDFRTYTSEVPQRLFELPPEYAAGFLRAVGDDEGCVQDSRILIYSTSQKLMQGMEALMHAKFPELQPYATMIKTKDKRYADLYKIRVRAGGMEAYRDRIGFTHSDKHEDLERILARRGRGWKIRKTGTTLRLLLEAVQSPKTVKEQSTILEISVNNIRTHLKRALEIKFIIENEEDEIYELTARGRKYLQYPLIGLLGLKRVGQVQLEIFKALSECQLSAKELKQRLKLSDSQVWVQLNGVKVQGTWKPGLVELGLVERARSRVGDRAYSYRLTPKGRQAFNELNEHFPEFHRSIDPT